MITDLEVMADQAAQEIDEQASVAPASPRDRIFPCQWCLGSGIDRSRWAWLWGGSCWVCGGWGVMINDPFVIRGPFAPQPGRYGFRGGSHDTAKH